MKRIIRNEGLIVVIRGVPERKIVETANALYKGGVRVAEVAFNPSDENTISKTSKLIKSLTDNFKGKMVIGAGTVIKGEYLDAAVKAGAEFIVSPDINVEIIKRTKQLGLLSIPGAFTPSECTSAYNSGADFVKLFPITENEITHLKNIVKPLSHIPFFCFGGANTKTASLFINAGAVGVGACSCILKAELIENEQYDKIAENAAMLVDEIKRAKKAMEP